MILPEAEKIAVRELDLCAPLADFVALEGYQWLWCFARLNGVPVGHVVVPVVDDRVSGRELREELWSQLRPDLARILVERLLSSGDLENGSVATAACSAVGDYTGAWPMVTVAVCTRDRAADLERCLAALVQLDYPNVELLVIDNAPSSDDSARVVERFPSVRYVREPLPGLDWARNRAIAEARGELIAYTDDDVVVDRGWLRALAAVFAENPTVAAVTGLVVPLELETECQIHFERNGGFSRGTQRRWFGVNLPAGEPAAANNANVGKCGTGANMAYRRSVFERVGVFDPALDVGTATNGGGDLEMFFRIMKAGYLLVYEPRAVVHHRHRRDYASLRAQIANNGVGYYSFLARSAVHFPEERRALYRLGAWWLGYASGRRWIVNTLRARPVRRDLAKAEFFGSFVGMRAYSRARREARRLVNGDFREADRIVAPRPLTTESPHAVAVRRVAVESLGPLEDVTNYSKTRVFVSFRGHVMGHVDIANLYSPISRTWLCDAIAEQLWLTFAEALTGEQYLAAANALIAEFFEGRDRAKPRAPRALPGDVPVSIVIATFDRPVDLRMCLASLRKLEQRRSIEVVVVDNHPSSGLTPPVVAEFSEVKLVAEPRQGLSYARNAGIRASSGEIVACTDDDVVVAHDWIERLVAPFTRADVRAVTGNTLPIELETVPQQLFELYGGLGRGYQPREVGSEWFASQESAVPTWTLGATANAAFRRSIFRHPQIGYLEESLGPGTPTGVGEDTYLFYKILKAGHTLVYEPRAVVWHRHRTSMDSLKRQLFNYSKGHVAYHLHTLLSDNDTRALVQLCKVLPRWRAKQVLRVALHSLLGRGGYPMSLVLLELAGNLLGPVELARSSARARRLRTA